VNKSMLSIQAIVEEEASIVASLKLAAAEIRKQTYIAMNQATADGKSAMAKAVQKEIVIAQANVKPFIKQTKRATASNLESELTVEEGKRISLKYFAPRKTRRGISYRIDRSGGRKELPGGFGLGPESRRLGGHVWTRTSKKRLPIVKAFGPSAWGVVAVKDLEVPVSEEMLKRFRRRLQARLRYLSLKKQGVIRG
jgi:hypothetical protein